VTMTMSALLPSEPVEDLEWVEPPSTTSTRSSDVKTGVDVDSGGEVAPERIEGLPIRLVEAYADLAIHHARVVEVDPGVWVASVVGLDGAWADGDSRDEACAALRDAVIGWVAVKRRVGADIPKMEGIDLNTRGRE
jgi:predicted RNase H-like HicB family nuclease